MANLLSTTVNGQLNTGNVIDLGYTVNGSIATTEFRGINFHSFGDLNYYIGKPAGSWTQPLDIHFYTGIRLKSHGSYGGTKFINLSSGNTLMTVGDGNDYVKVTDRLQVSSTMNLNYDQLWTSSGNLHLQYSGSGNIDMNYGGGYTFSHTSFRAPIFYDSNDTTYYGDFASTSNLNYLNLGNTREEFPLLRMGAAGRYAIGVSGAHTRISSHNQGSGVQLGSYDGTTFTPKLTVSNDGNVTAESSLRAPIFYDSNNTDFYGDFAGTSRFNIIRNEGVSDTSYVRFVNPGGGYNVNSSPLNGAIKIKLPTAASYTNTMLSFTVKIYNYSTGTSRTIYVGGYTYFTTDWYNVFAYQIGDNDAGNLTVRFGKDATTNCVWIGETDTYWSYPNVFITDVQSGHSQPAAMSSGWNISFQTSFDTVQTSRVAYSQINAGNIASQSVSYADESGYSSSSGSVEWTSVQNKPATFPPSAHNHDDRYYTESESDNRYAYKEGSSGTNFYANAYYQYEWTRIMGSGSKGIYWQEGDGAYWHIYPRNQADMRFRTGSGNGGIVGTVADETARGYIHWTTSNEIGFLSEDRNWVLRTYNRGVEVYGELRAPIFYDSTNTSYYLDPTSTTSIRTVGSWRADSSAWDGEFSGKIQYHSNHWYIQAADLFIYRNAGGSNVFTINQSGDAQANSSMRAPIFYDSNDTAYYGDFASLSRVNEIGANKMRADTNGNFSTDQGWWSHDPYGYGWGKPHGSFRSLEVSSSGNFSTEPAMFRIHQWGSGAAEFWKPQGRTLYLRETPGGSGSWFDTFEVQGLTTTTSFGLTNGFRITSGGSDYASFSSWVYLPGAHGFYSAVNGAHFYPNNATYGSWRISGSRNGWHGIHFDSGATLMMNSNESGVHREGYGWQFRWENGTMYCHKNSYGGGTSATVLDTSNFTNWAAASSGNTGVEFGSRSLFFTTTNYDFTLAPRTSISSMSIKLWDNYFNGSGLGSDYGSLLDIYGRGGHVHSQFYMDAGNGIWYRSSPYAGGWNTWGQFLTSLNFTSWAQEKENQRLSTTSDVTHNSTTSPTFLVNSHSDNTKGYRIHNTSGSSVSAMFTNSSNQLVIAAGAFDQINLNKKVYVNGVALGVNVTPSSTAGRIDASNDIVAYSSSDERLKHNITPIENAIDKVKSLTGVEFDWKPEYKHAHGYEGHDTGIIAQQVQEVIPSAVRTNDTGFLAVRYEKLIGLLVEGMKEQQAQIEELKAKLDGLTK